MLINSSSSEHEEDSESAIARFFHSIKIFLPIIASNGYVGKFVFT